MCIIQNDKTKNIRTRQVVKQCGALLHQQTGKLFNDTEQTKKGRIFFKHKRI